jgi:hypothetical protein
MPSVERIYVAASSLDARYTRTCVASIRFFYPQIPIRLLVGGRLQRGLSDELQEYWDVGIAEFPATGNYGWGFVKLEPLFGPAGQRFLILDSDTVLTGPVLDLWHNNDAQFVVDEETQPAAEMKAIYYDWQKVRELDPDAHPPRFLFNTGQWFGTAGILTRNDFAPWLAWTMPRRTIPSGYFMNGEQGILNYVLNRKAIRDSVTVERRKIMRWPAHSMEGLDVQAVTGGTAPVRVVHWAGIKGARQRDMVGADLLALFEKIYYERLPAGHTRRVIAGCRETLFYCMHNLKVNLKLAARKRLGTSIESYLHRKTFPVR